MKSITVLDPVRSTVRPLPDLASPADLADRAGLASPADLADRAGLASPADLADRAALADRSDLSAGGDEDRPLLAGRRLSAVRAGPAARTREPPGCMLK